MRPQPRIAISRRNLLLASGSLITLSTVVPGAQAQQPSAATVAEPLAAWNDGTVKEAVMEFVARVTTPGTQDFVPVDQRIATFDNDGTLWPENPLPFELAFAIDRVKAIASDRPQWREKQPYKPVLEGDLAGLVGQGRAALAEILMATHAGMTTEEFDKTVRDWSTTATHPRFNRLFTELAYQPMLELLAYLRTNGFKTFIVSGGGAEFMRVFSEQVYGIPPEQVIGTLFKTRFELRGGEPVLVILPEIAHWDDKAGKPVAIHQLIGRRPIAAFGNSDGDLQMLQLTTIGRRPSFGMIVRHTDSEREWAYDRNPKSTGKLVAALDEAEARGWIVVDMRRDWNQVFVPMAGPRGVGGRALQ